MANPAVTIDSSTYDTTGYVKLTFTNATKGTNWYSWRVKRRLSGTVSWTLLREYVVDEPEYEYHDTTVPANTAVDYSVTRVHLVAGTQTEEDDTPTLNVIASGTMYWLIHPTDEAKNMRLRIVTSDSYHDDFDFVTHRLIGRGRKVDQSTSYGVEGSLSMQIRTDGVESAASQLTKLETLKASPTALYLKTPFGQVWLIALGKLDVSRVAGVGISEFVDVTFPYSQVSGATTSASGGDTYGGY